MLSGKLVNPADEWDVVETLEEQKFAFEDLGASHKLENPADED